MTNWCDTCRSLGFVFTACLWRGFTKPCSACGGSGIAKPPRQLIFPVPPPPLYEMERERLRLQAAMRAQQ